MRLFGCFYDLIPKTNATGVASARTRKFSDKQYVKLKVIRMLVEDNSRRATPEEGNAGLLTEPKPDLPGIQNMPGASGNAQAPLVPAANNAGIIPATSIDAHTEPLR